MSSDITVPYMPAILNFGAAFGNQIRPSAIKPLKLLIKTTP
jgi:hypothetical protein